ncbi:MAG: HTH domain-containing protein, partial [Sodaliphilus sp.]|nr:HTH domain-containing protein [Sodaliphilus sp.]
QNEPINVKVAEHVNTAHLTDRQRKIYEIIKNGTVNGTVNAQNLSAALDISLRTAKRDLYVLRDMNLIHYVGSDKTGHWEIVI